MKKLLILLVAFATIVSCTKDSADTLENTMWDRTHEVGDLEDGESGELPSHLGTNNIQEDLMFGDSGTKTYSKLHVNGVTGVAFFTTHYWKVENDYFYRSDDNSTWEQRGTFEIVDATHIIIGSFDGIGGYLYEKM